tara:strand:- start:28 stop:366 length:339 start_codon:yes stop_codon:yes gene_type:complete
MSKFNLKEALAGAKVITVGGDEVTQLTLMNVDGIDNLVGVYKDEVLRWNIRGVSVKDRSNVSLDLKMAPVMGSGFLYVFKNNVAVIEKEKSPAFSNPAMIFDLSKYPVGFGL